tara:strand:+ start:2757 stop:3224 length:468 start_codon:yes stop_codon:yes gene_type:complete
MKRRDFVKSSGAILCSCVTGIGLGSLISCEDNSYDSYDTDQDSNTGDISMSIDISLPEHSMLSEINGTSFLSANVIDSKGLLLVRSSNSTIKAFSRRCTHSSYQVVPYSSNGIANCSSSHGGSFDLNGNVVNSPPVSSLRSYETLLENNILKISK